ncbi:hypothetical protein AB0I28_07605 [Phytomonospora sp. NPDC050363]|uniref:hypothetical protein n=1 Tax=Phytomonospora sp. NPDC050363 TaxID=3155642 RepID=UPI0033DCC9C9
MRLRPYAAVLAAVVLFGATACSDKDSADPAPSGSPGSSAPAGSAPPAGGDAAARAAAEEALAASLAENSYVMTVTAPQMNVEIAVDYKGGRMRMKVDGTVEGETLDAEVRVIDGKGYARYSGLGENPTDGKWVPMSEDDLQGPDGPFVVKSIFDPGQLIDEGAAVTAEGANVYKITPGSGTVVLPGFFSDMIDSGGTEFVPVSLLMGTDEQGRVSTMELVGADGAKVMLSVQDYGSKVKVDKPADSDIMS